jgi:hypothetical protein
MTLPQTIETEICTRALAAATRFAAEHPDLRRVDSDEFADRLGKLRTYVELNPEFDSYRPEVLRAMIDAFRAEVDRVMFARSRSDRVEAAASYARDLF